MYGIRAAPLYKAGRWKDPLRVHYFFLIFGKKKTPLVFRSNTTVPYPNPVYMTTPELEAIR
jgi:hypothetical protein